MRDMQPADIVGAFTEHTLGYFGGERRKVLVADRELPFPEGKLIVSRTDLNGVITQCNQAFIDMSGFARDEIIGQPHSILRHPDMPKAAYADLWSTVMAGKKWHGYVKNLRKDGAYYWVHAVVIPNVREGRIVGFTSVRRKPARRIVEQASKDYVAMKAREVA